MTYLWREEKGINRYRVQTYEKPIADKMKRRNGFKQVGMSIIGNNLWVVVCEFSRPDIARKTLKSIIDKNPIIDSEGLIFY